MKKEAVIASGKLAYQKGYGKSSGRRKTARLSSKSRRAKENDIIKEEEKEE